MTTATVIALCGLLVSSRLHAQVSTLFPERVRDSLAAADARSPTVLRNRQQNLDSLAAGRRRWAAAGVIEYQIQVEHDCFCFADADSTHRLPLVIVRNGKIVGRDAGKPVGGILEVTTVDSLFDSIERDLADPGRVVNRLDLDSRFGFPREYRAETVNVSDVWLRIRVDSFAVIRSKPRN